MTALDQAFIRAYGQDGAEAPAAISAPPAAQDNPPTAERPFRPMLQVDDFCWPGICRQLEEAAGNELDRLADAAIEIAGRGQKVLAIAGCRRGEGTTALVLALARRLVERRRKVVLADANLANPRLAPRLAVQPQHGWEEVIAGRMPLEEVIVESVLSGLGLLPVCGTSARPDLSDDEKSRMADSLGLLASHYDLVLVDAASAADPATLPRGLDALLLVHNMRTTTPQRLAETERRLSQAGMPPRGIIQNFVQP